MSNVSSTKPPAPSGMSLYDDAGARKYLTPEERADFLKAAEKMERKARTLCMVLAYSGCRLSEALALTADRVDMVAGVLTFESLKKRRRGIYRAVPVPPALLDALDMVHGVREAQGRPGGGQGVRLWEIGRTTAWRRINEAMNRAGISGAHANPKGLRHAFGVAAIQQGIALNMVQKWLGHADLATTAIYADAIGQEEQDIAARMWG